MMREFQVLGAAGAVVAGSIIDIAGIERLSFPVYATGIVPAYDDMRMAAFGRPVNVGSLRVATGDLLVADRTGVLRVPADAADAVIAGLPGSARSRPRSRPCWIARVDCRPDPRLVRRPTNRHSSAATNRRRRRFAVSSGRGDRLT